MKIRILTSIAALLLFASSQAYAVPVLQVGAPGASGEGYYADYLTNSTDPTEEDTAITAGNLLYAAGTFGKDNGKETIWLGGKSAATNQDWSDFGMPIEFNGMGAVLVASVANGATGRLTVNGHDPFYMSSESYFPNNHDFVKNGQFLFFDIGNFEKNEYVKNFADESGAAIGEIKELLIAVQGYEWVHFDVMALLTDYDATTGGKKTNLASTLYNTDPVNNPGSHDVTWKKTETQPVPEPGTIMLLGAGFVGVAAYARRRKG